MTNEQTPPEEVVKHLEAEPRRRKFDGVAWLIIGILIGVMSFAMWQVKNQGDRKIETNATKIDQLNELLKKQQDQFKECSGRKGDKNPACATPIVPPVTITPVEPDSREDDKPLSVDEVKAIAIAVAADTKWAPTEEQYRVIASVVVDLLPKQPTQQQITNMIIAAVNTYCANDRCRGRIGPTGPPGSPGPTGSTGPPGEQGPGPTQEQIRATVAAYCAANNDCKGRPGRGIVELTCDGNGRLVAKYDQPPHEQTIENSNCRVAPAPTQTMTTTSTTTTTATATVTTTVAPTETETVTETPTPTGPVSILVR